MFQTLSVAYASEVCPVALRGYLTTYANICWVIGQILSSGVLRALLSKTDEWAYRIPFALQWMFIPPIAIGVVFAPEVSALAPLIQAYAYFSRAHGGWYDMAATMRLR